MRAVQRVIKVRRQRCRAPSCDAAALMGLTKHLLARIAVVRVGFVPHQQTTAEHALLANAAPNFGVFRTGAACRRTHVTTGVAAATSHCRRARSKPSAYNPLAFRKIGNGRCNGSDVLRYDISASCPLLGSGANFRLGHRPPTPIFFLPASSWVTPLP
ncbi:hypothetical protein T492DRAFT_934904 [Pavlovales sp. CCMP2436]|nr:hypothetical protein T492DRAFT_934904 [Pavlovales sp. CCMP2436]